LGDFAAISGVLGHEKTARSKAVGDYQIISSGNTPETPNTILLQTAP